MRDRYTHWETQAVRWGDMDALGHVNNAQYFVYCESARMSLFEHIDLASVREHERQGPALVTATCNFKQQVKWPATIEVGVCVSKIGGSSFTLEYGLFLEGTEERVADGSSVVVWVDYAENTSAALPGGLRVALGELLAPES